MESSGKARESEDGSILRSRTGFVKWLFLGDDVPRVKGKEDG
jgi:hypothetical protein